MSEFTRRMPDALGGAGLRTVVVSPHLDDAALSLGATIAAAARRGHHVSVLTVFAGDPESLLPAGTWDRFAGFSTSGEAATTRRVEDRLAAERLGAHTEWLPFVDSQYPGAPTDGELWVALRDALAAFDRVMLPGFPLSHADHARLTRAVATHDPDAARLGFYVEQPYAAWGREASATASELPAMLDAHAIAWRPSRPAPRDWVAKLRAARAYRTQLRVLKRFPVGRILLYEAQHGGEALGAPTRA